MVLNIVSRIKQSMTVSGQPIYTLKVLRSCVFPIWMYCDNLIMCVQ